MSEPSSDSNQPSEAGSTADPELARLLSRCAGLRENSAKLANELDNLTRQIEDQLADRDAQPTPHEILSKQPRAD